MRLLLPRSGLIALGLVIVGLWLLQGSCALMFRSLTTGGEEQLKPTGTAAVRGGPHVVVFALDGAGPDQLMDAIRSGKAPHIAALLGKERGAGLFEHAYAAPHALSVLPSSTIAAWAATFTGKPPAMNGVTGDEWFVRETATFYAPVPISVLDTLDVTKVVNDDLLGKSLRVPTLYEILGGRSHVSLLYVHDGATLYTTVAPSSLVNIVGRLIGRTLEDNDPENSLSAGLDLDSVQKLTKAIDEQGVPDLQVVYFPGIDIFTHVAKDRLAGQVRYLESITDKGVGAVLDAYQKKGALAGAYAIFTADHAQVPTLNDDQHKFGTDDESSPFGLVAKSGFRVRRPRLILGDADKDYQAVLAYQGFMAYVYLADRSTCSKEHAPCDWKKPPRFQEDVMPVVTAFYEANRTGRPIPRLKGTMDLIFAREPASGDRNAKAYQIFDGRKLVPIGDYLRAHPRPDLIRLEERMNDLSAGPYGNRAGDILLLARACTNSPIEERHVFAAVSHYTWHGSACEADGHIPFILAQEGGSGERLHTMMGAIGGDAPSGMAVTPLVRALFGK
jgi:hypothetical protein